VLVLEAGELASAERERFIDAIRAAVSERTGLHVAEVVLVAVGTLPKTSSGKRQRRRTRELWAADALGASVSTGRLDLAAMVAKSGLGLVATRLRGWR
jgi:acyl-coenzyme A synthetase/AMP-(fatty) acid ligase